MISDLTEVFRRILKLAVMVAVVAACVLPAKAQMANMAFQGFESGSISDGWTAQILNGDKNWEALTTSVWYTVTPHTGSYMAWFDSYSGSAGYEATLISPQLDFSEKGRVVVSLWVFRDDTDWALGVEDKLEVYISTTTDPDDGVMLDEIFRSIDLYPSELSAGWYRYSFEINTNEYYSDENYVIIKGVSDYGNEVYIDDVSIDAEPLMPDAGIIDITASPSVFREGVQELYATIQNYGRLDLTSSDITWSVSLNGNVLQSGNTASWSGSLAQDGSEQFYLGTFDFTYPAGTTEFNPFEVTVATTNPNDAGADQNEKNDSWTVGIAPILNDASVEAVTRPSGTFDPGSKQVWVSIKNLAPKPLESVTLNWSIDGIERQTTTWTGRIGYNETEEVLVGSFSFPYKMPMAPYDIMVWTSDPNGEQDEDETNDAFQTQLSTALTAGTYYVGGTNHHFTSVYDAVEYLGANGIYGKGSVDFSIRPGYYEAQLYLGSYSNNDNQVTFLSESGSAGDVIISFRPVDSGDESSEESIDDYLWQIDGSDKLTFLNLTFNNPSEGPVFELLNGTELINFGGCIFNGAEYASQDPVNANIYSVDNQALSIVLYDNVFNYGSAGFFENTPMYKGDITVTGNTFNFQTYVGLSILNAGDAYVFNNTFRSSGEMPTGIALTNGGTVAGNTISGLQGTMTDFNEAGIRIINDDASAPANLVENNTITNSMNIHGMYLQTFKGVARNNTISVTSSGWDLGGIRMINSGTPGNYVYVSGNDVSVRNGTGFQYYGNFGKIYGNKINANGENKYIVDAMGNNGYFANNMFSGSDNQGVKIFYSGEMGIYYNSFVLSNNTNAPLQLAYGNVTMKRNLIINNGSGPALTAEAYSYAGTLTANENDIYTAGPVLAKWENTDLANLAAWQTASSQDAGSVSVPVIFNSYSDLHLLKYNDDAYKTYPLDLDKTLITEFQEYDFDNDLRTLYFYGADNIMPEVQIVTQPQPLVACVGTYGHQIFTIAEVTYGGVPTYQWEKNGEEIPGATEPILNLDTLKYNMSGIYRVRVQGVYGTAPVYSDGILVYVLKPTEITAQPLNQYVENGERFSVEVGTHIYNNLPAEYNPRFQWFRGTQALADDDRFAGTKSSILSIRDIQPSDYGDDYYVKVFGLCGEATSERFAISLPPDVIINSEATLTVTCQGNEVSFVIEATPTNGATGLLYQWRHNNENLTDNANITGTNTNTLNINDVKLSDEGSYDVVVTVLPNKKEVTSNTKSLAVLQPPVIERQPEAAVALAAGEKLTLSVDVSSTFTTTYQWYKDGNPLDGKEQEELTIDAVTEGDAGSYTVKVTNMCGEVTSTPAVVTVTSYSVLSSGDIFSGGYTLRQNQPNPVDGSTLITWFSPVESDIRLTLSDAFGREIAVLADKHVQAGEHSYNLNSASLNLSAGVYIYTLTANSVKMSNTMVVVK